MISQKSSDQIEDKVLICLTELQVELLAFQRIPCIRCGLYIIIICSFSCSYVTFVKDKRRFRKSISTVTADYNPKVANLEFNAQVAPFSLDLVRRCRGLPNFLI